MLIDFLFGKPSVAQALSETFAIQSLWEANTNLPGQSI